MIKQQYKIVIERDEDGYFVATVPAFPGCSTQAKTMPELTKRVREAIVLCLSVAKTNASYRKRMKQFAYEPTFVGMEVISMQHMGGKIRMLKARDVMRVLCMLGFEARRQSGSHIFFQHRDGRTTLVPKHGGEDIGRGLLRQILREIEVTPDSFLKYL